MPKRFCQIKATNLFEQYRSLDEIEVASAEYKKNK